MRLFGAHGLSFFIAACCVAFTSGVAGAQLIEQPDQPLQLVPQAGDGRRLAGGDSSSVPASPAPAADSSAASSASQSPLPPPPPVALPVGLVARPVAVLQVLDKVSARVTDLRVPVGQSAAFGLIMITVRTCQISPPAEMPEAAAFLQIGEVETRALPRQSAPVRMDDFSLTPVFSGWMFASSPAVSKMEHPTYDVVVKGCAASADPQALVETRAQPVVSAAPAPVAAPAVVPELPPED